MNALRGGCKGTREVRGGCCKHPQRKREVPSSLCPVPCHQVISLTFGKFDVEPDTYCRYDSVSVFNGAVSDDAKRLGKFCGDTAPG